jgi:hypothetical protein
MINESLIQLCLLFFFGRNCRQLSPRQVQCQRPSVIVTVYVTFRLLYSVFLTLSVILPVTSLIVRFRPDVVHLLTYCYRRPCIGHVALRAVEETAEIEIASWEDDCMQQQRKNQVFESCDRHVAQLVQRVDDVISLSTFQQKLQSANLIDRGERLKYSCSWLISHSTPKISRIALSTSVFIL